jgi:flagellar hook-associated protein 2
MSSSTSPIFSGTSTFSSDFTQVINRAVSIASLPITQLNSNHTTLTSEQSALSNLSGTFSALQTAIASLGTAAASGNYSVNYSDKTVASATASSGALLGTYSLDVVDPGSQASAASTAGVTDPTTQSISSSASFTLTANGQTYANILPPPGPTTLTSLVSAINTATQGAVQATIVNVGTQSQPNFQLSIKNSSYGPQDISLLDENGADLMGTPTAATAVQYRVNGQPDSSQGPLSSDSRTLTLSTNLSVNILQAGSTDITVGQSTSNIATAIQGFVTAYNAASQALIAQRGSSGGALAGQNIVNTLSQALHNITSYSSSGSVQSMADLGLTFNDNTGTLSFDSTVLSATAAKDFAGVTNFLGSPTSGGFLQTATSTLNALLDSTSGTVTTLMNSIAGEITTTDNLISTNQARVDQLQTNLTARMSAADAAIASMQQQLTYMTSLFTSMTANQNQITNG